MSLTNKIDFAVVFKVQNANPNGDPLNGNRPRTTYDGLGELTDVCLKRKIRNRLMENGFPIFVQSDDSRVDNHLSLRSRADEVLAKIDTRDGRIKKACETWFDVRAFGQLFAFKSTEKNGKGKKKVNEEAENTGDDKSVSIGIRGPVSIPTDSKEPVQRGNTLSVSSSGFRFNPHRLQRAGATSSACSYPACFGCFNPHRLQRAGATLPEDLEIGATLVSIPTDSKEPVQLSYKRLTIDIKQGEFAQPSPFLSSPASYQCTTRATTYHIRAFTRT